MRSKYLRYKYVHVQACSLCTHVSENEGEHACMNYAPPLPLHMYIYCKAPIYMCVYIYTYICIYVCVHTYIGMYLYAYVDRPSDARKLRWRRAFSRIEQRRPLHHIR